VKRYLSTSIEELGDREVGIVAVTDQLARDGNIWEPGGIELSNYVKNPIVLFQHEPMMPVAIATAIGLENGALAARVAFAPLGTSDISDQCCALVKAGIVRGVSCGIDPIEVRPLNNGRGGVRIVKAELLEISFVSLPADTGAMVTARGFGDHAQTAAMFRSLPAIPRVALTRAAAKMAIRGDGKIVSHAGHVWALQQLEREKEKQFSYEQRQADLAALSVKH
jgi:HK97 family phage prohead protease